MRILEFIINTKVLFFIFFIFSIMFVVIVMAKSVNLVSEFILTHLASQEFGER